MTSPAPRSPLFPYTALFRSQVGMTQLRGDLRLVDEHLDELFVLGDGREDALDRDQLFKALDADGLDRKSTRLNSSHTVTSYAVFCLKKKSERGFGRAHNDRR